MITIYPLPPPKLAFLSAMLLFLIQAGCATIAGRRQIVSIDSVPRGLLVKNLADQQHIGITPFFTEIKRQPSLQLAYSEPDHEGKHHTYTSGCHYRILASLLGNAILTAANIPLGVAGYATDFITGAAYECSTNILIHHNNDKKLGLAEHLKENCLRALLIPPYYMGNSYAMAVRQEWLARTKKKALGKCITYIGEKETLSLLAKLNYGIESPPKRKTITRRSLAYLGYQTRSDLLVILTPSLVKKQRVVSPIIMDIFTEEKIKLAAYESAVRYNDNLSLADPNSIVEYTASIFPNSIRFGVEYGDLNVGAKNNRRVTAYHRRTLPYFISLLDVATVSHRDRFESWDTEVKVYPKFPFFYWDSRYTIALPEGQHTEYNIKYLLTGILPTLEINFHTPMGALGFHGGAGALLAYKSADDEKNKAYLSLGTRLGMSYVAFISDKVYVYADASSINFRGPRSPLLTFRGDVASGSIGLGYYFSHVKLFLGK